MVRYAERLIKVRVPVRAEEDLLKLCEETSRKYGRKLTMAEIEKTLEERYGPGHVHPGPPPVYEQPKYDK